MKRTQSPIMGRIARKRIHDYVWYFVSLLFAMPFPVMMFCFRAENKLVL